MPDEVPAERIRVVNDLATKPERDWVLYWMTAFRRTRYNFALQHARDIARRQGKPLVILEALRVRYRWSSDRLHRFVVEGMADNIRASHQANVLYYPYVETAAGQGSGLVHQLALRACAVVSDDFPCFFHPKMIRAVRRKLPARLELVDSNCLMPLAAGERTFTVAHSYRRFMQKELPKHLEQMPEANPIARKQTVGIPVLENLPESIVRRWPQAEPAMLLRDGGLSEIPVDHSVSAGSVTGGAVAAGRLLDRFMEERIGRYATDRNEPDETGSSELSPHLHFGHISSQEIFLRLMESETWHPGRLNKPNGKVTGFWGVGSDVEAFLDQLCCWRELGFNMCWREANYDRFESLPAWAQQTMREHERDRRPYEYTLEQFEQAQTHDEIWNAAQRQLTREGRIHNYLRMLWGKKILHWTRTPREALRVMIELNNKYALDGRDPNSYSGIFWVLGRYDRAWGPERPIFGKIRYMTSENTARKHHLKEYLRRYAR